MLLSNKPVSLSHVNFRQGHFGVLHARWSDPLPSLNREAPQRPVLAYGLTPPREPSESVQAGELLLAPPLQSAAPLLPAQLRAASTATGDLVFGHLPQAGDDTEVTAWQVVFQSLLQQLLL